MIKVILKIVLTASLFLMFSCENKSTLPDPLEAGWKGQAVCEVLQEDNTIQNIGDSTAVFLIVEPK